jgi:hypothetical protein
MNLEVDSASNRKEYEESSWDGEGGLMASWHVRLTIPPSMNQLSKNTVSTSHSHMSLQQRYRDTFTFLIWIPSYVSF